MVSVTSLVGQFSTLHSNLLIPLLLTMDMIQLYDHKTLSSHVTITDVINLSDPLISLIMPKGREGAETNGI
jgi:hypothetical protein